MIYFGICTLTLYCNIHTFAYILIYQFIIFYVIFMQLLYAKDLVDIKKEELKSKFKNSFFDNRYLAIIFVWDDPASKVFVRNKVEFGKQVWLDVKVYWQWSDDKMDLDRVVSMIDWLNSDDNCIGIIFQLPLPDYLQVYKWEILDRIDPSKDVDMLHSISLDSIRSGKTDLNTATVSGALELLEYYKLDDYAGKKISIVWQSNLIWRPLAWYLRRRWWDVQVYDADNSRDEILENCRWSDIVFSATGVPWLIDDRAVSWKSQIFVDFWYGINDGKICGDIVLENVYDDQIHLTPVPGWVGRMTVVCLFENIIKKVDISM